LAKYPALERTWQGETAGIDMLRIYKQSRVVLNDYVDMAAGTNVNMRTKEVMSVGSMLLTRRAANIESLERTRALATFGDAEECVGKIRHYLAHDAEREVVAAKGLRIALRDFNYRDISAKMRQVLESKVEQCARSWS
jgi:spore maturation protein CgeB